MTGIPINVVQPVEDGSKLPPEVIELPQGIEAPEAIPYVISFARYNEKMCEILELTSNKARKALEILKEIGTKICCKADFQRYFIDQIPIRREGEYIELYRGLEEDIYIKEIHLQQDARIFYFDIEPERTFYVVAIRQNHLEIDKVRR